MCARSECDKLQGTETIRSLSYYLIAQAVRLLDPNRAIMDDLRRPVYINNMQRCVC
jgi:hypothetical protein